MRPMTKLALVTGANRGIGRSTALQLAANGVDVIITYRSHADEAAAVVDELTAHGRTAVAVQLDVTDIGGFADTLAETLHTTFGRDTFDYLVNNGGMSRAGMIDDVSERDVDDLFAVHFKGVLFLTQKLLPLLADGGAI